MKKSYICIWAIFALVACTKESQLEESVPADGNNNAETEMVEFKITGSVSPEEVLDGATKTSYDFVTNPAVGQFSWVEGDKIAFQVAKNGDLDYLDKYDLTAGTPTNDGKTVEFSTLIDKHNTPQSAGGGSYTWNSVGVAFYPVSIARRSGADYTTGYDKKVFVTLQSSVGGNANEIALIGTPNDNVTNYNFKTAMGVLKITLTQIPASLKKVRISTNNRNTNSIDGDFHIDLSRTPTEIRASDRLLWSSAYTGKGYIEVDMSSAGEMDSRDFYFNIPTGVYAANTLTLELIDDEETLLSTSIKKELTFTRGQVIVAPSIRVPGPSKSRILGTYKMYTENGSHGRSNATTGSGKFVLEDTDDSSKGDIILSCFAGVSGKIYGTYDRHQITFNKDDLFGDNPFSNSDTYPYVAIDAFTSSVQNPVFDVIDADNLEYTLSSNLGFRATSPEAWASSYGGGWPWEICFGKMTATKMGNRVDLTPEMLTLSIDAGKKDGSAHYDGQGKAALTDGNYSTFWHTPYKNQATTISSYGEDYYSCADLDPVYGAYIDIDLGAGNEMTKFSVRTKLRLNQTNGYYKFNVYGTNDKTNWGDRIGHTDNAIAGINWGDWIKTPVNCTATAPVRYIRVAFTAAYNGEECSLLDNTTTNYMHLAELELYNDD